MKSFQKNKHFFSVYIEIAKKKLEKKYKNNSS